ncbi:M42 family metallopeptidase [Adlercreutzia sp. ZJ154]|uniref:M42 family metallopeptidase n=1 Tax=Adlercreutzia sp. ZJ154 TaxID=2709790 RepID=UPI0013EA7082|nr:M42 family metallopeptidase [Adlercreutzia sp. ZJ154]
MKKKQIKFLKKLVETPSPTGSEEHVAEIVRERMAYTADWINTDTMGSVHLTLDGRDNGPSLMLSAHMDEVGLMVTYISDEGFLSVASIGGVDAAILPGMRVDVHTSSGKVRGVVGRKPIHLIEADDRKQVTPLDKLVIDVGLSAKEVKQRIRIGDAITYGVGFERYGNGLAVSRGFDDKVGVFIACRVMENLLQLGRSSGDFTAAITVQEEIGTRGAITSAHSINPDIALAFDVTHATDYPGIDKSKYGDIRLGKGPVIARGPNINPCVFERLVAAAKEKNIPYQIEAEPSVTGTDARAIQISQDGIPTGLISIPLRYMHTPTEVISLKDVQNAIKLITTFTMNLDRDSSFIPGIDNIGLDIVDDMFCDMRKNSETDGEAGENSYALDEPDQSSSSFHDVARSAAEFTEEMKELIAMAEETKKLTREITGTNVMPGPTMDAARVAELSDESGDSTLNIARNLDNVAFEYASDAEVMNETSACAPAGFPGADPSLEACEPKDESLRPEL